RADSFGGFNVDSPDLVHIPGAFFSDILPRITSLDELQVTMAIFRHLAQSGGGFETPIAEDALAQDRDLRFSLREEGSPREPDRRIALGLDLALSRGCILRFIATNERTESVWYYVNTSVNRAMLAAMTRGAVNAPAVVWVNNRPPDIASELPNAFRLYEQNIGPLTPMLADQIRLAIEDYPADWIEDAIGEAVAYNRRSWRYISRILENWIVQGRSDQDSRG
ncbi:MAG: DnaD domain protein, partial [Thermomicrobiales bacterium]